MDDLQQQLREQQDAAELLQQNNGADEASNAVEEAQAAEISRLMREAERRDRVAAAAEQVGGWVGCYWVRRRAT